MKTLIHEIKGFISLISLFLTNLVIVVNILLLLACGGSSFTRINRNLTAEEFGSLIINLEKDVVSSGKFYTVAIDGEQATYDFASLSFDIAITFSSGEAYSVDDATTSDGSFSYSRLPVGMAHISVDAYEITGNTLVYSGNGSVEIIASTTATLSILLNPAGGSNNIELDMSALAESGGALALSVVTNNNPVISDFYISLAEHDSNSFIAHFGDVVSMSVTAQDPDGDALAYEWEKTALPIGVSSIFSTTDSGTLTMPSSFFLVTDYNISVIVSDGKGGESKLSFNINLKP